MPKEKKVRQMDKTNIKIVVVRLVTDISNLACTGSSMIIEGN